VYASLPASQISTKQTTLSN